MATTAKCSDSDMLLSAKKEARREGGVGGIFMTSNDLVIPAGIRLRIPSLLVFPGQVSCGEKPKAMVFPFCSRGAALRLMSTSEEEQLFKTTAKSNQWTSVDLSRWKQEEEENNEKKATKKPNMIKKNESVVDCYPYWCCGRFGATS